MMRNLFLCALIALATTITDPRVDARITPQSAVIYPNAPRTVDVLIDVKRPVYLVVAIVKLTSPVSTTDPNCDQSGDGQAWLVCRWFNITETTTLSTTFTMQPVHIVTTPINDACGPNGAFDIGTPLEIAVDGQPIYDDVVWSAYRPGYCIYMPGVTYGP